MGYSWVFRTEWCWDGRMERARGRRRVPKKAQKMEPTKVGSRVDWTALAWQMDDWKGDPKETGTMTCSAFVTLSLKAARIG